jgi:hypothetical protein
MVPAVLRRVIVKVRNAKKRNENNDTSSHPVHTDCVSLLVFIIPARGNLYVFCHVFSGVRSHEEVEYFFYNYRTNRHR